MARQGQRAGSWAPLPHGGDRHASTAGFIERPAQVLRNLLSNALRHTPAGGHIVVSARASESGDTAEVAVSDTGEGIAAEHLPYVFERFYRADPSRTRSTGGAGIGLAIVKQLVETHGGRVSVDSALGTGTTVRFTLPLASSDPGTDDDASPVAAPAAAAV